MTSPLESLDQPFWRTRDWWYRAGHASLGLWVATGLSFVASVLAARNLGPGPYGSVLIAISAVGLLFALFDLTLDEAVMFHGSQFIAARRFNVLRRLLRLVMIVDLLNGVLILLSTLLFSRIISEVAFPTEPSGSLISVAALAAFGATVNGSTGAVLLLAGRPHFLGWMNAWTALIRVLAIAVAVQIQPSPVAVIWALAVAAVIGSTSQAAVAEWVFRRSWPKEADRADAATEGIPQLLRELMRFGALTGAATSLLAARDAVVPLVLGQVSGARSAGLFGVAQLPVTAASVASAGLRISLPAEQARMAARGNWHGLKRSVRGHFLLGLAIGVPSAVAGYLLLPLIVPAMYSSAFSGSVDPARVLLIAAVIYLAIGWSKTLPPAVGRPGLRTAVAAVDLGVTVLAVSLLADRGPIGAAVAVVIATAIVASLWPWLLRPILSPPSGRSDVGA